MDLQYTYIATSLILLIFACFPYFRDIFAWKTKPHVYTWLIWSLTQWIWTAGIFYWWGWIWWIYLSVSTILVFTIFIASFFRWEKNITLHDTIVLLVALMAIWIWVFLDHPLLSVLLVSAIDVIWYIPTFRKSYSKPYSETASTWATFTIANIFSMLALSEYNLLTMSYLVAISFMNIVLLIFIIARRSNLKILSK